MTDVILPRSLQEEYEGALKLLTDGVEDGPRRCELVGIVRDYVDKLERTANRRGEKLKELAERATSTPARRRELVGRLVEDGTVFQVEVPAYDVAWLADQMAEREVGWVLRPSEPPEVWARVPSVFVLMERPVAGDLLLMLRPLPDERESQERARFAVVSMVVAGDLELEAAPLSDVTATRVCAAIAKGTLRVNVRQTIRGVEVRFEDVT